MLRPATPGWGPLLCGGGWPLVTPGCGAWLRGPATPGWGPPPGAVVGPSPLLAEGRGRVVVVVGAPGAFLLGLGVCVCAVWRFVLAWVAWGGSCAVWLPCVCVCVRAVCGWWGVSYLGWFSSSVGMVGQKAEEKQRSCRRVAEMRGMRIAKYIPLYLSYRALFPLV